MNGRHSGEAYVSAYEPGKRAAAPAAVRQPEAAVAPGERVQHLQARLDHLGPNVVAGYRGDPVAAHT